MASKRRFGFINPYHLHHRKMNSEKHMHIRTVRTADGSVLNAQFNVLTVMKLDLWMPISSFRGKLIIIIIIIIIIITDPQ
jgi:hypothetical protein